MMLPNLDDNKRKHSSKDNYNEAADTLNQVPLDKCIRPGDQWARSTETEM